MFSDKIFSVWLKDAGEVNDYYLTFAEAHNLALDYLADGYSGVNIYNTQTNKLIKCNPTQSRWNISGKV